MKSSIIHVFLLVFSDHFILRFESLLSRCCNNQYVVSFKDRL